MPLIKLTLEQQILGLLNDMSQRTEDPAKARQDFAKQLSTMIDAYIKSGLVNVTVVGTSPAGPVTGTGTGTIS